MSKQNTYSIEEIQDIIRTQMNIVLQREQFDSKGNEFATLAGLLGKRFAELLFLTQEEVGAEYFKEIKRGL